MKFSVGYQAEERLKRLLLAHRERISEVYFPWRGFATGRGVPAGGPEAERKLETDLADCAAAGIGLHWLLNGNCCGRDAQSRLFFQSIGDAAEYLIGRYALGGVTTASPLIAKFLKANFPTLEIRASVNMEIGAVEGVEYVQDCFDAFYLKRECNYDRVRLETMYRYCRERGKKLYLLANSGCLNFCSARTFHDNLVAHQHEIAGMDNGFDFPGVCHEFLRNPANRARLLDHSNFIRPEDVALFEGLCDGMKLATRTNRNPSAVLAAYLAGRFSGNLLELTEPAHAADFYPDLIANHLIAPDYAARRFAGESCFEIQKNATLQLEDNYVDR